MLALPDHYLTPEELVDLLRLPSVETLYAWRKKGAGPAAFRVGRHLRYDPDAVRTWIDRQTTEVA